MSHQVIAPPIRTLSFAPAYITLLLNPAFDPAFTIATPSSVASQTLSFWVIQLYHHGMALAV